MLLAFLPHALQSRWTEKKAEGEVCGCRETVCPSVMKEQDRNEEEVNA